MIVAIDGPAGAGKSTMAKGLADRLGVFHLDTGAMYRAVTLACQLALVDLENEVEVAAICRRVEIDLTGEGRVLLEGEEVTRAIRAPGVTDAIHHVAENPRVREVLVERQRELARDRDVVCEGRDIGTVVFPDADLKLYVDASPDERARRRLEELRERGEDPSLAEVRREIDLRDRRDADRDVAPLRRADDALHVDTTALDPATTLGLLEEIARDRLDIHPESATAEETP